MHDPCTMNAYPATASARCGDGGRRSHTGAHPALHNRVGQAQMGREQPQTRTPPNDTNNAWPHLWTPFLWPFFFSFDPWPANVSRSYFYTSSSSCRPALPCINQSICCTVLSTAFSRHHPSLHAFSFSPQGHKWRQHDFLILNVGKKKN